MFEADEEQELARVMGEIAEAMSARAAVLTLHPQNGPVQVLHVDTGRLGDEDLVTRLAQSEIISLRADEEFRWAELPDASGLVMVLPVRPVPGHNQLLITVFFDAITPAERLRAEQVYRLRRPFAVGFFRLWQMERVQRRRTAALESALHLTEMAVFLLDRSGAIVFSNQAGQHLIAAETGLFLQSGCLHAHDRWSDRRLMAAIDHVLEEGRPGQRRRAPMLTVEQPGRAGLVVSILPPEHAPSEPGDIAAIVFALDPDLNMDVLIEAVGALFSLTPTEAKLARLLTNGASMTEAAEAMRVREATARNYLKQIFLKTNTNRQADLVRLIMSSTLRTARNVTLEVV